MTFVHRETKQVVDAVRLELPAEARIGDDDVLVGEAGDWCVTLDGVQWFLTNEEFVESFAERK